MSKSMQFGTWTLTCLVIANMLGAGVFTTSGFTLASLRTPQAVVLAWVVGGLVAMAGAVSYGRLIRLMPESGGEYLFLSRAVHPFAGFLAGWISLIAGFTGAIAYAATAFEGYLLPGENRPDWLPERMVAIAAVVVCGLFHGFTPRTGSVLQNLTVGLKITVICGFLLFAVSLIGGGTWQGSPLPDAGRTTWQTIVDFAGALVWISFSYSGFNAAVYVAGEAADRSQIVPRSLLLGTGITTLIYVLLNAVFVFATPAEMIADKPNVATLAARWIGGPVADIVVRSVITVALLTSVSSMLMAAPRVYARMADDGLLPVFLRFGQRGPVAAVLLQVVLACGLICLSTLHGLLTYLGLTLSLTAAATAACLLRPSIRNNDVRVDSGSLVIPVFYIAATTVSAVLLTINEPRQLVGTAVTFAVGAIVWFTLPVDQRRSQQPSRNHADPDT